MYTQWMVIKGMVFVLVTLNHLSNSMSKSTSTSSLLDTSLNGGKKVEDRRVGIVLQEDENFFTEESFTPLNQIRMNEEQVCVHFLLFSIACFSSACPFFPRKSSVPVTFPVPPQRNRVRNGKTEKHIYRKRSHESPANPQTWMWLIVVKGLHTL